MVAGERKKIAYVPHEYDSDVQGEMSRLETEDKSNYQVFVKDLRKVYHNGNVAVLTII
jgi:hypothetical protein